MIDAIIARLKSEVAGLGERVQGAAELSALVRDKALPQVTPAAYVLPLGLRGRAGEAAAGAYTQIIDELAGVVIVQEAPGDATGGGALAPIDSLKDAVIAALAGWSPGGELGVLTVSRGQLVSLNAGTAIYQLDFSISDQVRIFT